MRTLVTLPVIAAALAMVLVMGPTANAGTISSSAKCASTARLVHQIKPTGMAWQLVRPDTAKALHISACSIILDGPLVNGQRSSLLITPRLRVLRS